MSVRQNIFKLLVVFLFIIANEGFASEHKIKKSKSQQSPKMMTQHFQNETQNEYTDWSIWSRCMDCYQRRMKTCLTPTCQGSRLFEERPCHKKRCKRKMRMKDTFHIVRLPKNSSHLTKQAPHEIWSRWSAWSDCNQRCRTERIRRCRKPGRCSKKIITEEAYCYHEGSRCEVYVLNLIEKNKLQDTRTYQYNNNQSDAAVRQSRRKSDSRRRCGIPNKRMNGMLRIIGGTESLKNKWPWHVAVLNQHREVICGGTLINSRWVLTANHCIRKFLQVRLNVHDLQSRDGSDITMTVYKMFSHPKFDYQTVDNDIALLMLPKPVRLPVACLPTKKPKTKQLCSVMGWGKTDPSDRYGINVLHEAQLLVVPTNTCKESNKQLYITNNMLCAGWASGKADTCAGDSGGGLMCPTRKHRKTIYTVEGITSFGDGCGMRNKYGIYTTVYNYINWIEYIINNYSYA